MRASKKKEILASKRQQHAQRNLESTNPFNQMQISMIYYNTRGLNSIKKQDRLINDLAVLKPDVLALSETRLVEKSLIQWL